MHKLIYKSLIGILLYPMIIFGSIGVVKEQHGTAYIIRGSKHILIKQGSKIEPQDILKTGKNSWVKILMNDGTLISAAKNSKLKISDFVYDKPKNSKATFNFFKGLFKVISGGIGKVAKEKFKVTVPGGTIGIRGTEFYVDLRNKIPRIFCTKGAIFARNSLGEVLVPSGNQTFLRPQTKPAKPTSFSQRTIRSIIKRVTHNYGHKKPNLRTLIRKSKGGILGNGVHNHTLISKGTANTKSTNTDENDLSQTKTGIDQRHKAPNHTPIVCPSNKL